MTRHALSCPLARVPCAVCLAMSGAAAADGDDGHLCDGCFPRSENASFAPFYAKLIILPRQARDKHRDSTQEEMRVPRAHSYDHGQDEARDECWAAGLVGGCVACTIIRCVCYRSVKNGFCGAVLLSEPLNHKRNELTVPRHGTCDRQQQQESLSD